jgi:hypothetical protein
MSTFAVYSLEQSCLPPVAMTQCRPVPVPQCICLTAMAVEKQFDLFHSVSGSKMSRVCGIESAMLERPPLA